MKFLVLTQNDRCDSASKVAQTSAARSYLASQRHARRRDLKTTEQRKLRRAKCEQSSSNASNKDISHIELNLRISASHTTIVSHKGQLPCNAPKSDVQLPSWKPLETSLRSRRYVQVHASQHYRGPIDTDCTTSESLQFKSCMSCGGVCRSSDIIHKLGTNSRQSIADIVFQQYCTLAKQLLFDPFCCLPLQVTAQEKSTLHFCETQAIVNLLEDILISSQS